MKQISANRPINSRAAFTLVELLIVISIIAILTALLLPALGTAKSSAHTARCKSNLRQVSMALSLFVDDHGVYPLVGTVTQPRSKWYDDLRNYTGQSWTNGLYTCPGYKGPVFDGRIESARMGTKIYHSVGSYGYNVGTADKTETFQLGIAGKYVSSLGITQTPIDEREVKAPGDLIVVGDSFSTLSQKDGRLIVGLELLSRRLYSQLDPGEQAFPNEKEAVIRHRGKMNVVFGDTHVEADKFRRILLELNPRWLRRWHTDNEPHLEFFQ